jgi:uncharacterized Rossmann fold enzyme
MEYPDWREHYEEILRDFGYDPESDRASAAVLEARLPDPSAGLARLQRLAGRSVTVLGPAPLAPQDTGTLRMAETIIVADSAAPAALEMGLEPCVIATDLDGEIESIAAFSRRGCVVVVHAHGDNAQSIAGGWNFGVRTVGSCQCQPFGRLRNFGGFTDGDRAALLAEHFGASTIELVGFDFDKPIVKAGGDYDIKARKLRWAHHLIETIRVPVYWKGERFV